MNELTREQKSDLLNLADYVETEVPGENLDMGNWVRSCGTAGCLAFHAAQLFPDRLEATPDWGSGYEIVNLQTGRMLADAFEDAFGPGTDGLCYCAAYPRKLDSDQPLTPGEVAEGIRKFVKRS